MNRNAPATAHLAPIGDRQSNALQCNGAGWAFFTNNRPAGQKQDKMLEIIILLMTPLLAIINGWTLHLLWDWFVVESIGLPPIAITHAIGIGLIVRYLTHQQLHDDSDISTKKQLAKAVIDAFMHPLFVLFIGYIVTWFM